MVCISFIGTDILLLLFAQHCPPLLRRKREIIFGFLWIVIPAFSRRFCWVFLLIRSPLKAYVLHSFKVCFQSVNHKVLKVSFITAPVMSDFENEDWLMFTLITHLGFTCLEMSYTGCLLSHLNFYFSFVMFIMSDSAFHHVVWA